MEKNISEMNFNPFSKIGKEWMLITAEAEGKVNTMTASWCGMGVLWGKNVAFIFVRNSRFTKEFIDKSGNFSLGIFDHEKNAEMLGYMGRVSGRDEDKIAKCGLSVKYADYCSGADSSAFAVPYFEEAKESYICKKLYRLEMPLDGFVTDEDKAIIERYYSTNDLHNLYVGEIVKVLEK